MSCDFRGFDDWIHVFTAGEQTDSKGQRISFTQADLDQVVANHNPKAPPPHVITHKELYSPFRFGDIAELKREGDHLYARSDKVSPQLEQLVEGGFLPDRSIRLHKTDAGYQMAHLAWLGAEPPAVAELEPVQFAAGDTERHDFMLGAAAPDTYTPNVLQRFARRLREWAIDKFDIETANQLMPDFEIEMLGEHIDQMQRTAEQPDGRTANDRSFSKADPTKTDPKGAAFRGHPTPDASQTGADTMSEFTQAELDAAVAKAKQEGKQAAEADFAKQSEVAALELATERRKNRIAEFSREVDSLATREGKVHMTPAQTAGLPELMATLAEFQDAEPEAVLEFSRLPAGAAKDAKPDVVKVKPLEVLRDFMKALGPQLETGKAELGEAPDADRPSDFKAPTDSVVDAEAMDLHRKALDYQAKHPEADYMTAINFVSRQVAGA